MGHFAKIGTLIWIHYDFKLLHIFTKCFILEMFYRFLNVPILTTLRSASIHMKHDHNAAQKRSFPMKIFSINVIKPQFYVDLVAFTEEILIKL